MVILMFCCYVIFFKQSKYKGMWKNNPGNHPVGLIMILFVNHGGKKEFDHLKIKTISDSHKPVTSSVKALMSSTCYLYWWSLFELVILIKTLFHSL